MLRIGEVAEALRATSPQHRNADLRELLSQLGAPIEVDAGRAGTGMIRRVRFSADQPREAPAALTKAGQPAG